MTQPQLDYYAIEDYMKFRGQVMPDAHRAFEFALTEWGEFLEIWKDYVNEDSSDAKIKLICKIRYELGDIYQMLQLSCFMACGCYLEDCGNFGHIDSKATRITIILTQILDGFLRQDRKWVRNNYKEINLKPLFSEIYLNLSNLSLALTKTTLVNNLIEKWEFKGYNYISVLNYT